MRLALGQIAKFAVFGVSLVFPAAGLGRWRWLWRDHERQLIFALVALASTGIGAIYGVICSRQRVRLDDEAHEMPNRHPELVVTKPQRKTGISHYAPLSPKIANWIVSPSFTEEFLVTEEFFVSRSASASENWALRYGKTLLLLCLTTLNIVLLLPKWLLGSLLLSSVAPWDTCDRFDVADDLQRQVRIRSTLDNTDIDDKTYMMLPEIPQKSCEEDSSATTDQTSGARHPRIEDIHRDSHLLKPKVKPRYLCFLDDSTQCGYRVEPTDDSIVEYVFISYTTAQFRNVIEDQPLLMEQDDDSSQGPRMRRDRSFLTRVGVDSAIRSGVAAFWIDFECIMEDPHSHEPGFKEDVYRICDVVRASRHMVIVVGPPFITNKDDGSFMSRAGWLKGWGDRLWTIPEALLCPSQHDVEIVTFGCDKLERVAKRNLAHRVWDSNDPICGLIGNLESSCPLTPREVFDIVLPCMRARATSKKLDADFIYALQGLLRRRLMATPQHSDFTAFAQLCVENDTQQILESMLCLRPKDPHASWHALDDIWGARVWDVKPDLQMSSVNFNSKSTIEMGGSPAALIDWYNLAPVQMRTVTGTRWKCWHAVHLSSVPVYIASFYLFLVLLYACLVTAAPDDAPDFEIDTASLNAYFISAGIVSLFASLASPYIWTQWRRNKVEPVQARFYGIEGKANLVQVEAAIFGCYRKKIDWTEDSKQSETGDAVLQDLQTYTLVDTFTMTASTFTATKPPSVVMVFGRCSGQVRAVLCSFDSTTCSFTRETILRMETKVLDRMHQVGRFKLSVNL